MGHSKQIIIVFCLECPQYYLIASYLIYNTAVFYGNRFSVHHYYGSSVRNRWLLSSQF